MHDTTATVTPDGAPAVSPKGTTAILDERTIALGDIRSPQTVRNIRHNPAVELNFIDVFRCRACYLKGRAEYVAQGSPRFEALLPHFARYALMPRMRGFVVVSIEKAQIIHSPIYDDGATEAELRKQWLDTSIKRHGAKNGTGKARRSRKPRPEAFPSGRVSGVIDRVRLGGSRASVVSGRASFRW